MSFFDPTLTGMKGLCVCYFTVELQTNPLKHNVVVVSRKEQQSLYGLLHLYPVFFSGLSELCG